MNAARHLTVRNLPEDVAKALDEERRRRGVSLNRTVVDLLRVALGVGETRDNGLGKFSGIWSEEEYLEFRENTADFEQIDPEVWQ